MNFNYNDQQALKQSMGVGCLAATIIFLIAMTFLRRLFGGYFICTAGLAVAVWILVTWFIFMVRRHYGK